MLPPLAVKMADGGTELIAVSDNIGSGSVNISDEKAEDLSGCHVSSELLFFIQNRGNVLAVEDLVSICSNFYSLNEVEAVRQLCPRQTTDKV